MKNLLLPLVFFAWSAASAAQSPYLKEILMGRCYFEPPTGAAGACPAVVGSIMNVLESRVDGNIKASAFDTYLQNADFSSQVDKAFFHLRFWGKEEALFATPSGLQSPEDTPGGALLKNLMFCGVDQVSNCSVEKSNAYWTFWEAAYAKFASQTQGDVKIVVDPLSDVQFFQRSAIANFPDTVSSATLFMADRESIGSCASSKEIRALANSLKEAGVTNVLCKEDLVDLYVGAHKDVDDTAPMRTKKKPETIHQVQEPEKTHEAQDENDNGAASAPTNDEKGISSGASDSSSHDKHRVARFLFGRFFPMILAIAIVFGLYYFYVSKQEGNKVTIGETAKNLCNKLGEIMHEAWMLASAKVHDFVSKISGNDKDGEQEENQSETSPLIIRDEDQASDLLESGEPPETVVVQ